MKSKVVTQCIRCIHYDNIVDDVAITKLSLCLSLMTECNIEDWITGHNVYCTSYLIRYSILCVDAQLLY